jgi:hypothetical protein
VGAQQGLFPALATRAGRTQLQRRTPLPPGHLGRGRARAFGQRLHRFDERLVAKVDLLPRPFVPKPHVATGANQRRVARSGALRIGRPLGARPWR